MTLPCVTFVWPFLKLRLDGPARLSTTMSLDGPCKARFLECISKSLSLIARLSLRVIHLLRCCIRGQIVVNCYDCKILLGNEVRMKRLGRNANVKPHGSYSGFELAC